MDFSLPGTKVQRNEKARYLNISTTTTTTKAVLNNVIAIASCSDSVAVGTHIDCSTTAVLGSSGVPKTWPHDRIDDRIA